MSNKRAGARRKPSTSDHGESADPIGDRRQMPPARHFASRLTDADLGIACVLTLDYRPDFVSDKGDYRI